MLAKKFPFVPTQQQQYAPLLLTNFQVFGNCVGGGVNLFDTAEVYGLGRSEYLCGKFRRDYKGAGKSGIVIGESGKARRRGEAPAYCTVDDIGVPV